MRILIDIGHPADVHLFRNFYKFMSDKHHDILITARDKDVTIKLLDAYALQYISYGKPFVNPIGKLFGILKFDFILFKIAKKFKPDIFLSLGSVYSGHVASLIKKPNIIIEDTGNMEQIFLYKPFTDVILTPASFPMNLGSNQIRFKGTKELAYLHPNQFSPDIKVLGELGLKPSEKFVLLRYVAWNASHDIGHKGISYDNKIKIIQELSKYAKVFISSESELPKEMNRFRIRIKPEKILDVLYYSELLYGESATMASECAILGTPAIFVNNANICYTQEQEKQHDLVYNFSESAEDQIKSIDKAIELIKTPNLKTHWRKKTIKMLSSQIDLTAFLIWFIENYPASHRIMKEIPAYQYNFK
jgi:hypothetical protein